MLVLVLVVMGESLISAFYSICYFVKGIAFFNSQVKINRKGDISGYVENIPRFPKRCPENITSVVKCVMRLRDFCGEVA